MESTSRENATPVISKLNLLAMNTRRVFNVYKLAKTGNIVKRSRIIFFLCSNVHGFMDQKRNSIQPSNWSKT